MAKRGDESSFVYHWVKSNREPSASIEDKYQDAFETLLMILKDNALRSGKSLGHRFGHECICFTQTPVWFMVDDTSKYQPFGLEFHKLDIYKLGGEHVIYCSKDDANRLSTQDLWKWMRHEPLTRSIRHPYGIDFSWEREIRVNRPKIGFMNESEIVDFSTKHSINCVFTRIYVPDIKWKRKLINGLRDFFKNELHHLSREVDDDEYADLDMAYREMYYEYTSLIECIS